MEENGVKSSFASIKDVCSEITARQLSLSELKLSFEDQEKNAKARVEMVYQQMVRFANQARQRLLDQVGLVASRRRAEMELINNGLSVFPSQLLQLYSKHMDSNDLGQKEKYREEIEVEANRILEMANDLYSGQDWEKSFFTTINIWLGSHIMSMLSPSHPVNEHIRVTNTLYPELLILRVGEIDFQSDLIHIEVELNMDPNMETYLSSVKNFFPHILLSEFILAVTVRETGDEIVFDPTTFKDLKSSRSLVSENRCCLKIKCQINDLAKYQGRDVIVQVTLSDVPIKNSPFLISLNPVSKGNNIDLWQDLQDQDQPKRKKRTDDLDESDIRALGLNSTFHQTKIAEVIEEEQGKAEEEAIREPQRNLLLNAIDLPLNQPSPIAGRPSVLRQTQIENSPRGQFCPGVASTESNIGMKLRALQSSIPKFDTEDKEEFSAVLESNPSDEIDKFQENLSKMSSSNGTKKNVSFHHETTIVQPPEKDSTQPYKPGSMDLFNISKGTTKTIDGDMSLCKGILKSQSSVSSGSEWWAEIELEADSTNSVWEYSKSSWEKYKKELEEKAKERPRNEPVGGESMWDKEDEESTDWESRRERNRPKFDLSQTNLTFQSAKRLRVEGIPQSVARDKDKDITYVSDIDRNVIHRFTGWDYTGVWPGQVDFIGPRYVLCIPDITLTNRHGMDLVVLDQAKLYLFKSDGTLRSTLLVGFANRFRGLAYHSDFNHVISIEKIEGKMSYLCFIEVRYLRQVVKRVGLEQTSISGYLAKHSCKYLTYATPGIVVATDMGNGVLYKTDLKTDKTEVIGYTKVEPESGLRTNQLKDVTGVAVDPAGNILVANLDPEEGGKLMLFSPGGAFLKVMQGIEVERPLGMLMEDKTLYIVDVRERSVCIYNLTELQSPQR